MLITVLVGADCAGPTTEFTEVAPEMAVETGYVEFGQSRIYYEIEGVAYMVNMEKSEEFNHVVLGFLEEYQVF